MTVAAPSMQEVLNVLHIRTLIDPEIARLVAESATKETLDILHQSVQGLEEASRNEDRVGWSKADTLYHETLSNACPNFLLGQLGLQMRNRTHLVATDVQTTPARLEACTLEHQEVVDAIARRDVTAAQEAMRNHVHHLRESFFKRLTHG
jgi:DNA-binding GntR family transcriptional regulator